MRIPTFRGTLVVMTCVFLAVTNPGLAQTTYKLPPREVVDLVDAPPPPVGIPSPDRTSLLLVDVEANPPIALLARPILPLAGVRIDASTGCLQRTRRFLGLSLVGLTDGATRRITLPSGATLQPPVWSPDGKRFAFARDTESGVELWIGDVKTATARAVPGVHLVDVLDAPFGWLGDGRRLLAHVIQKDRGSEPPTVAVPAGPDVQETAGKRSRMATFQDLLRDEHDAALFAHYATSQLALVDADAVSVAPVGEAGLYTDVDVSPDNQHILLTRLLAPYSYRVPYGNFARATEIWDVDGTHKQTLVELPVADEVPQQGVPTGARDVQWQPLRGATLLWAEALDGGDPLAKVPQRDRLLQLDLTTAAANQWNAAAGREVCRLQQRWIGTRFMPQVDEVLVGEYDRSRRWTTTWLVNMATPQAEPRKIFDLSANDAYADPGQPVMQMRSDGQSLVVQDGESIYLAGRGATPQGDRPFLDRMNLKTLKKERLFQSESTGLESFAGFTPSASRKSILTSRQSRREPPNWFVVDPKSGKHRQVSDYRDPAPQLTNIEKRLLTYHRPDGVALSGFLYLPVGYKAGTRLPLMMWAYPLEYSDAGTAGQVRGSANNFTRLGGDSPLFFLTQGYAVLMDAAMPVVGDPETMNDTFVEQIVAAAKAAIDTLDTMGVIDRNRVCVGGHSYGAFMTANLLAHSDLFAAGIARSGAYNRSLTPFGFQAERRSYWEATDVYTRISPFTFANKINEPLLLVHGEMDNNPGTFPIQSERLFQALQANGGTSRLVLLPNEAHGYRSRESVLTVLAEMFEWADRYVKNRPAQDPNAPVPAGNGVTTR